MLGLGVATVFFTSSKKENQENIYLDQLKTLEEQPLVDGSSLSADSINGKMLIVSFWASYDATSRVNSYNLLSIRDEFRTASFENAEGLEVVCVSLDIFKSPVRKAIESDGTGSFYHICDLMGEDSPLASKFDVNRPVNLLISPDGHILARDFGTQTISETLEFLSSADNGQAPEVQANC